MMSPPASRISGNKLPVIVPKWITGVPRRSARITLRECGSTYRR
jgi:hypothetical protein